MLVLELTPKPKENIVDITTAKLIEKMVRAKVRLENSRVSHKNGCLVESDPEGYAPCNCGASATNSNINSAIKDLSLE